MRFKKAFLSTSIFLTVIFIFSNCSLPVDIFYIINNSEQSPVQFVVRGIVCIYCLVCVNSPLSALPTSPLSRENTLPPTTTEEGSFLRATTGRLRI